MVLGRGKVSAEAAARYQEDQRSAAQLDDLLDRVHEAEKALRAAPALEERHIHSVELDRLMTRAMRAAYAAERVAVGPRGYDDRLYRRRQLAKPKVRELTQLAERLLTLRETHRLQGQVPVASA